jgi:hypothetical protein
VIDASRAWVVEQHVYDPTGQTLIASAIAESHRYYPAEGVSLPQRISLRLPTAGLAMKIDLGAVQINQLAGDPNQLWTIPTFAGYPQYDLGGAVPNTPVPGRPFSQPLSPLGPPATMSMPAPYPTTGAAVTPASVPPPTNASITNGLNSTPTTYPVTPASYAPITPPGVAPQVNATPPNYMRPPRY